MRVWGVYAGGGVGSAGVYVGVKRSIDIGDSSSFLFSSSDIGDNILFISSGSPLFRRYCNKRLIENYGVCTFFIAVYASLPSNFRLTVDIQSTSFSFLQLNQTNVGVLQPHLHKTLVFTDLKPNVDYRISCKNLHCQGLGFRV